MISTSDPNYSAISALITWTHTPNPSTLEQVLQALTDNDLLVLAQHHRHTAAGRLAWMEYGQRSGYYKFKLHLQQVRGRPLLVGAALAQPIQETLGLDDVPKK